MTSTPSLQTRLNASLLSGRGLVGPALIVVLSLSLNLAGNARTSLWDRDEPRYATSVREMRARGDWLFPTFNGEPRYQKPILIYWLMRAGVAVGGDNPFGARLVSALAGTATCVLTLGLGRRALGPRVGLLAGLIAATAPIMVVESKLATTDATLTFLIVGCHFCLWELSRRDSRMVAAGFWCFLALGLLTKGPVAPAILAASGLASWWWGGPAVSWRRLRIRWGLPACMLLTAPWYLAIGVLSRGDYFRFAVGTELVGRMRSAVEQHGGFPGYYLASTLLTFYPWSTLIPAAACAAWSRRRQAPELSFLLGWMVGPLVLFECMPTKLIHYYLPAIPACALLTAWMIVDLGREGVSLRRRPLGRLSSGLLAGIALTIATGLIAAVVLLPSPLRWSCLLLAAIVTIGTLFDLDRLMKGAIEPAALGLAATWGLWLLVACGWLLPAADSYRMSRRVGERLAALASEVGAAPILLHYQEPGVVYALKHPVPTVRSMAGLYHHLDRHKRLIAAVVPDELQALQAEPRVVVEIRDSLESFNVSIGRTQKLDFVVISGRTSAPLANAIVEESAVK